MITGGVIAAGVAAVGMKAAAFPLPVALIAGAAIGGPIAAISYLNNDGKPNKLWQSAALGAAPMAVIGGTLGLVASAVSGGKIHGSVLTGAAMFGAVGAGIGSIAHVATKPH